MFNRIFLYTNIFFLFARLICSPLTRVDEWYGVSQKSRGSKIRIGLREGIIVDTKYTSGRFIFVMYSFDIQEYNDFIRK
ncbi:hypothetical protein BpHYR1_013973 [Brachionus plicatilis]|uniref:Secreted protein n=1 Tax=Brachionus plicatilis TaxID=10195 RepID=A0A3M7ST23_BRAPC|nr:hypothetical protein BpHYR1_013973 [Brachionus plicatilis]